MAFSTGTATGHADLMVRLVTFLTATLPVGQRWTALEDKVESGVDRLLYFRAPGLAGTDEIFTQLYHYQSIGSDYYNWGFRGQTGHISANLRTAQPGVSSPAYMLLWQNSIPYWFIGNGRRVMVIARVSTVYQVMYMGFITPSASPSEYPYPLFIGGTGANSADRWSVVAETHRAFFDPAGNDSVSPTNSNAHLRTPGGGWRQFANRNSSSGSIYSGGGSRIHPYNFSVLEPTHIFGSAYAGGYGLMPTVLFTSADGGNVFGELDGVFHVSGFSNASENLVNVSGVNHLVVQNVYRTGVYNYAAFRLE
jgi:hypothetical protein